MRRLGITLTDFYNQAVKGVKETKIPKTLQKAIQRQEEGGGGVFKMRTRGVKEAKPKAPLLEKLKPEIKPKKVKVPYEQLPVGEGKEIASRLEKRIISRLKKVPEEFQTATYRQMNKKEQIQKAVDYVVKNEDEAMQVLLGKKEPPKGLLHNSIFIAMEEKAKKDADLALKLASLRATRAGQEISILTEVDKNNPVKYLSDVVQSRIKIIGGQQKVAKYKKILTQKGEKVVKKNYIKKDEWASFIESIKC